MGRHVFSCQSLLLSTTVLNDMVYIHTYTIQQHKATLTYFTYSGIAPITNGISTVTINGLACGVTYNITAGGKINGQFVRPRSSLGTITAGPCPPPVPTTTVATTSMTGKEKYN